jgi:hypothetical protein
MVVVGGMILFWILTLCRIISLFWLVKELTSSFFRVTEFGLGKSQSARTLLHVT